MIDIKWIRQNPDMLDANLASRNIPPMAKQIIALDKKKRNLISQMQQMQHERNNIANNLSHAIYKNNTQDHSQDYLENHPKDNNIELELLKLEASKINFELEKISSELSECNELDNILNNLPNVLDQDVPIGSSAKQNKIVSSFGHLRHEPFFLHHQDIGQNLGFMDFKNTASMSGSKFVTLTGDLARLERALMSFFMDFHTQESNFYEISPPYIVKDHAMYNSGILPKFSEDSFKVENGLRLIPTAEVPLINLFADQIIPRESLPIRMVSHTPCFRLEAGSTRSDTKGLIRMHQFSKVELVSITVPEESEDEHNLILTQAQKLLEKLELPYRTMLLCSGDTGFQSSKTYDIEVYLPSQKKYVEISSCSNCHNFQARRMKTRYKEFKEKETTLVHTLNGSALPLGRTIAAILENYQNSDGSVNVPECLIKHMDGVKVLTPKIKI